MTPRVRCPVCSREIEWSPASHWRPFCSERCKLIDLGDWASERHVIQGDDPQAGDSAEEKSEIPPGSPPH